MNFLNLQYFMAVAEELNITRAAEKLYISQQSLSNHIAKLEKELGVELFTRTTPLSLTYAGERLAKKAAQILDLERQLLVEMEDINDNRKGKITIGISHTRGRVFLPSILPEYKKRYPGIELCLVEGNSVELEEHLLHGRIDLLIGFSPINVDGVETIDILVERIFLLVPDTIFKRYFPENHEQMKAKFENGVDISMFADCPFLMITSHNRVRTIADEYLKKNGIRPNIILETENIETLLSLCIRGMGITFYPEMFVQHLSPFIKSELVEPIHAFPLNDRATDGTLVVGYLKNRYLSNSSRNFIKLIKEIYPENTTN
jgi:DNA-binding transcriptional LysR family regulator